MKMTDKKIKNEIDWIELSMDVDKFDYGMQWNAHFQRVTFITPLSIAMITIGLTTNNRCRHTRHPKRIFNFAKEQK